MIYVEPFFFPGTFFKIPFLGNTNMVHRISAPLYNTTLLEDSFLNVTPPRATLNYTLNAKFWQMSSSPAISRFDVPSHQNKESITIPVDFFHPIIHQ